MLKADHLIFWGGGGGGAGDLGGDILLGKKLTFLPWKSRKKYSGSANGEKKSSSDRGERDQVEKNDSETKICGFFPVLTQKGWSPKEEMLTLH